VGVWVCGCVGVWVCGCVGEWVGVYTKSKSSELSPLRRKSIEDEIRLILSNSFIHLFNVGGST
jgi:hypothetical protein